MCLACQRVPHLWHQPFLRSLPPACLELPVSPQEHSIPSGKILPIALCCFPGESIKSSYHLLSREIDPFVRMKIIMTDEPGDIALSRPFCRHCQGTKVARRLWRACLTPPWARGWRSAWGFAIRGPASGPVPCGGASLATPALSNIQNHLWNVPTFRLLLFLLHGFLPFDLRATPIPLQQINYICRRMNLSAKRKSLVTFKNYFLSLHGTSMFLRANSTIVPTVVAAIVDL